MAIEVWDSAVNNQEPQVLYDFPTWREELGSVKLLGAWRSVGRNLITPTGTAGAVSVSEMTASGFQLAGVAPLMGRYLLPEDERPGASSVVVLGYNPLPAGVGRVHTVFGLVLGSTRGSVSRQRARSLGLRP